MPRGDVELSFHDESWDDLEPNGSSSEVVPETEDSVIQRS